jgi:hypothetical protein
MRNGTSAVTIFCVSLLVTAATVASVFMFVTYRAHLHDVEVTVVPADGAGAPIAAAEVLDQRFLEGVLARLRSESPWIGEGEDAPGWTRSATELAGLLRVGRLDRALVLRLAVKERVAAEAVLTAIAEACCRDLSAIDAYGHEPSNGAARAVVLGPTAHRLGVAPLAQKVALILGLLVGVLLSLVLGWILNRNGERRAAPRPVRSPAARPRSRPAQATPRAAAAPQRRRTRPAMPGRALPSRPRAIRTSDSRIVTADGCHAKRPAPRARELMLLETPPTAESWPVVKLPASTGWGIEDMPRVGKPPLPRRHGAPAAAAAASADAGRSPAKELGLRPLTSFVRRKNTLPGRPRRSN